MSAATLTFGNGRREAHAAAGAEVLLVDDDKLTLRMASDQLHASGFAPLCCESADEALDVLRRRSPSVIVSDYVMPGTDGVAFLRQARLLAPAAVRLLCTAVDDFQAAVEAVNSGEVCRIVRKPLLGQQLVDAVREAIQIRLRNGQCAVCSRPSSGETGCAVDPDLVAERTQALLMGFVTALEYRVATAELHSLRASRYARRLAEELGIGEPELSIIERGSLLHDVGKIGISDGVLHSRGPLADGAWEEMKEHPRLGWALLQESEFLREASTIVLQHHERWDGAGYPAGLHREEIAMGARVFAVADALDAITSDRSYRAAHSYDHARAEIVAGRGTQFDPAVVDAFLAIPPEELDRIRREVERAAMAKKARISTAPA